MSRVDLINYACTCFMWAVHLLPTPALTYWVIVLVSSGVDFGEHWSRVPKLYWIRYCLQSVEMTTLLRSFDFWIRASPQYSLIQLFWLCMPGCRLFLYIIIMVSVDLVYHILIYTYFHIWPSWLVINGIFNLI